MQKLTVESYDHEFKMVVHDEHDRLTPSDAFRYEQMARDRNGKMVAAHSELETIIHPECNRKI